MIDVKRFIYNLDACINKNDMGGARRCIEFWENEAREVRDDRALLTILNEGVGYYRRSKKKTKALQATEECLTLVDKLGLSESDSGAVVLVNAATTMAFFHEEERAIKLYDCAESYFNATGKTDTYEFAALLNNRAAVYNELKRYDEAERDWVRAIEVLKVEGRHDGEIAISLVMLAHLTYDRDDTAYEKVEAILDEAWDYLNSDRIIKDGNYAYVLKKCAPSFEYFKRKMEAESLREVAQEIYDQNRQQER